MQPYNAGSSLYAKLRRRAARLIAQRPARLSGLERPLLTLSFDDAPVSAAVEGAAILERHGVKGTYFISAGLCGQDSHLGRYATLDELQGLAHNGHEIACHTFSHLDCGRASGQEIAADLDRNQAALQAAALPASHTFAYPYGDVSPQAKRVLRPRYMAARALHHGLITTGTDLNQAPAVGIEGDTGEHVAIDWISRAAATPDSWLVLYTHDVRETPSPWGCTPDALERILCAGLKAGLDVVTFAEGAQRALGQMQSQAA